jgi:WD40 repeat protein
MGSTSGKLLRVLGEGPSILYELCLSPDGKTLVAAALDKIVRRWNLADGKEILSPRGHEASVNSIRFADKGRRLVSTGTDGSVRIWELASGKELYCDRTNPLPHQEPPPIDLAADGRTVAAATNEQTVWVRDRFSKKVIATIPIAREVNSIGFSPDGKYLAAGTEKQIIHLWDVAAAKECCRMKGFSSVRPPIFSPDSRLLAIMDAIPEQEGGAPMPAVKPTVGGIHIWGPAGGKEIQYIPSGDRDGFLTPLCFSPGGRMLVGWQRKTAERSGVIIAWEVATGRERFCLKRGKSSVLAAAFSPDGTMLAVGEEHVIHLWDVRAGQERQQFRSDQGEIHSLAFSEDGRQLASGGKNTTILLWPIPPSSWKRRTIEPELSAEKLHWKTLWSDLAGQDAALAFDSMKTMAANPASTTLFLRQHLRPVSELDRTTTQRLLADLDSNDLVLRE